MNTTDEDFCKNIQKCKFNYENIERAKRLLSEGKLLYVTGLNFGMFVENTKENRSKYLTEDFSDEGVNNFEYTNPNQ